jgi:hypothetical protein
MLGDNEVKEREISPFLGGLKIHPNRVFPKRTKVEHYEMEIMRKENQNKHKEPTSGKGKIPIDAMDRKGGNTHKINDKVQVERWLHDHRIPFETLEHDPA